MNRQAVGVVSINGTENKRSIPSINASDKAWWKRMKACLKWHQKKSKNMFRQTDSHTPVWTSIHARHADI